MTLPKFSEIGWTRGVAAAGVFIVTIFMVLLNTTGAWIASHNVYYTGVIAGVEILEVVVLVLILSAPTRARKIVGAIVFCAIIYVCVENGKISVEESFKDIFKDEQGQTLSPEALRLKANLAQSDADTLKVDAPKDRNALATEIAELKVEQQLMMSDTPPGIREAQISLKAKGAYTGPIDGLREDLTEDAMLKRGEQIRKRLDVLTARAESGVTPASDKGAEAINLRAKANEIDGRVIWLNILLFAIAGINAAGVWAFVVWDPVNAKPTVKVDPDVFKDLQAQADELARRKANIDQGVEKREKTNTRKKNREQSLRMIEDQRAEEVQREEVAAATTPETPAKPEPELETDEPDAPADTTAEDGAEVNDNDTDDSDAREQDAA